MQTAAHTLALTLAWLGDLPIQLSGTDKLFDIALEVAFVALGLAFLVGLILTIRRSLQSTSAAEASHPVLGAVTKQGDDASPESYSSWDLARAKLETYFDRNLAQVRMIFFVAATVMIAGFGFVLWGLHAAIMRPEGVKVAVIASASGVITQFIGLTFMLIYRSTMLQASQFMSVLDRINNVGMAVQILDTMGDSPELKDRTRADIIRQLLSQQPAENSWTDQAATAQTSSAADTGVDVAKGPAGGSTT